MYNLTKLTENETRMWIATIIQIAANIPENAHFLEHHNMKLHRGESTLFWHMGQNSYLQLVMGIHLDGLDIALRNSYITHESQLIYPHKLSDYLFADREWNSETNMKARYKFLRRITALERLLERVPFSTFVASISSAGSSGFDAYADLHHADINDRVQDVLRLHEKAFRISFDSELEP